MSDLNRFAATQAVITTTMTGLGDLMKIAFAGYAELLAQLPEDRRADVVLAAIAANTADTAAAERTAGKLIDAAVIVIPAVAAAKVASAERSAAAYAASSTAAREAAEERDLLNQIKAKATATKRWQD